MKDKIRQVSKELNIPEEVVERAYKSFFSFIKDKIISLPLKEDLTEEQFKSLRCNFNVPSLGKFHVSWQRYCNMKNRFKYIKNIKEGYECKEDYSDVYSHPDNNG